MSDDLMTLLDVDVLERFSMTSLLLKRTLVEAPSVQYTHDMRNDAYEV